MEILISEKIDKVITPFAAYLVLSWQNENDPTDIFNGNYVAPLDYLTEMKPHISNFLTEHSDIIMKRSNKPNQFNLPPASIEYILSKEYMLQVLSAHEVPLTPNSVYQVKSGLENAIWYQLIEREAKNVLRLESSAPPKIVEFGSEENSLGIIDCNVGGDQDYGTGNLTIYEVLKTNPSIVGKLFEIETLDVMKIHQTEITRLHTPDFRIEPEKTNKFIDRVNNGEFININNEFYKINMSEKIMQDMINNKANQ